jgi:hypothetical protein
MTDNEIYRLLCLVVRCIFAVIERLTRRQS